MRNHSVTARALLMLAALVLVVLPGCDSTETAEPAAVTVMLGHSVDGQALAMNQMNYTSPAGHTYSVSLLEYLVSGVTLKHEDGSTVNLTDAHYCNVDDPATQQFTVADVPSGRYTSLTLTFGIPADDNVFGNLVRTTDYDNMMWPAMPPMGDGNTERYHYMRFEGLYDGGNSSFRIHAGPSGGGDYSFTTTLPVDFQVDGSDWEVQVLMDLNQWLTGPNEWDFADYGMIMGNAAAQGLIKENGANTFSIGYTREK